MYRRSLITFIDILGFKHLIQTSTDAQITEKLATLRRFSATEDDEDGEGFEPKVIQFSDSIIRIRPLEGASNKSFPYGLVFHELHDLVLLQGELIKHGICLRGGIALGDVHFDAQTVFGPGFVRAYELESGFANFPRIVVDPEVLNDLMTDERLRAQHHGVADEVDAIRKLVRKDADGIFFVDYLHAFLTELDEPESQPDVLRDHKQLILNGMGNARGLNTVPAKYLWLANYHNGLVRSLSRKWYQHYDLTLADLEISSKEMPINFEWP
ncbi:MAG TPA: hypothetical protein PK306_02720 [Aquabacterium sp.]|jgi:hypothetical protein|uniref:hypothetical protein n=1 Tax=Comamonadaceae TaxID=80864 RepID=UPI001FCA9E55|nr:hypothetical protein [Delftia lacustris]BDE73457.1 hypothetical protein HQS1_45810 [Delftia lacustris]HQC94604.1 hypothetical protein [Aquabacterium sp.]